MPKFFASGTYFFAVFMGLSMPAIAAEDRSSSAASAAPAGVEVKQEAKKKDSLPIPDDVKKFEIDFNAAMTSGDADRAARFFSSRYLHDGTTKKVRDQGVAMLVMNTSNYNLRFTSFMPINKNRAYITAEVTSSFGNYEKQSDYQIIREKGQWRWLGNQKKSS